MTTYSAIANSEIAVGAPITNSLKTKERDNLLAIQENDASAPTIVYATTAGTITSQGDLATLDTVSQTEIDANSVGQSEIKTTYQTVSHSAAASSTTTTEFTATGGAYCLGHTFYGSTAGGTRTQTLFRRDTTIGTGAVASWNFETIEGGGSTFTSSVRLYYINSSPPYNLGDGDIPLFIYAIVDNTTKEVDVVSISPDPVWVYNGPTNCVPSRYEKDGRVYRQRKDMSAMPVTLEQAQLSGASAVADYLTAFKSANIIEEELTQDIKNADMNIIPHPFMNNDLTGKTAVLLDPVADLMEDLLEMYNHNSGEVADVINRNYLRISDSGIKRHGPSGLLIPSVEWRNT